MVLLPRYDVVGVFFILLNNARKFSHVIFKKDRRNERCSSLNLPPGLGRHLRPSPRCDCGILGQASVACGISLFLNALQGSFTMFAHSILPHGLHGMAKLAILHNTHSVPFCPPLWLALCDVK